MKIWNALTLNIMPLIGIIEELLKVSIGNLIKERRYISNNNGLTDKQHSKYINFYQQIDSLAFDDIDIKINIYPTYIINNFHIIIISKEGYGTHEYVTSSKIDTCFPISDDELNMYITNARCFFNKTKQLLQNYVRKSQ